MHGLFGNLSRNEMATAEQIGSTFAESQPDLEWLAYFITGDKRMASNCVVNARGLSVSQNHVFEAWLVNWARYATVRSAIQAQRRCSALLRSVGERAECTHPVHDRLMPEQISLVVNRTEELLQQLDPLSRIALVTYGIEGDSFGEGAILSGVSVHVLRAAYCAALQVVEALEREEMGTLANPDQRFSVTID